MQSYAIVMGGLERSYMRKLALYLNERLDCGVRVEIVEDLSSAAARRDAERTVWTGSAEFIARLAEYGPVDRAIILDEEECGEDGHVFRYQSRERLCRCIRQQCRRFGLGPEAGRKTRRQRWIAVTTDGSAAELLAFSIVCARILGRQERTLYVNLSECSGMSRLFEPEGDTDLSDLFLELRRGKDALPEDYAESVGDVDCLLPPENPMILHEIGREDTKRFLSAVRKSAKYGCVVFAVGNTFCGCEGIFALTERILHLAGGGLLRTCARDDWLRFIRMCAGGEEAAVEQIAMPEAEAESCGAHLIDDWAEGPLGALAARYLTA